MKPHPHDINYFVQAVLQVLISCEQMQETSERSQEGYPRDRNGQSEVDQREHD